MSYQVAARKWRPQLFEEVIGQAHITKTLQNAITSGRVAHAYLFSGQRGVGKTSMARIFARALNCEKGPTPQPCGVCITCKEIVKGISVDVIEIDGASNTGVDDIRELREAVKYIPVKCQYKIYIIDEVHMLSTSAFNALLKTLEEPPEKVTFIFATTELHKIPATILSRCQQFSFKRISNEVMLPHLQKIASEEKITVEEGVFVLIARAAEGSVRDALSLLDQAVAFCGDHVGVEPLRMLLGIVNQQILLRVTKNIQQQDTAEGLNIVDELFDHGIDLYQFLGDLVEHIRNLLIIKVTRDPYPLVNLTREEVADLKKQADLLEVDGVQRLLELFTHAQRDIKLSPLPRFTLELALVKATRMVQTTSMEDLLKRLHELEKGILSGLDQAFGEKASLSAVETPAVETPKVGEESKAPKEEVRKEAGDFSGTALKELTREAFLDQWGVVINQVRERKPNLASYLEQGVVVAHDSQSLTIGFPENASFLLKLVQKEEHHKVLKKSLADVLNCSMMIKWVVLDSSKQTPALPDQKKENNDNGEKMEMGSQPPMLKETLSIFGGEVVESKDK